MKTHFNKTVALLLLTLIPNSLLLAMPTGKWAVAPKDQATTAIFEFKEGNVVHNTLTNTEGSYFTLSGNRILIHFEDSIMFGDLIATDNGHELTGIIYTPQQQIELAFTPPNKKKSKEAQKFQKQLQTNIQQATNTQIQQAILQNLAAFASAGQMYMLLHGKTEVTYSNIIGPGKLIPQLNSIFGESYNDLSITHETTVLTVSDQEGIEHAYQF